jgi:hypothetical protein
MHSGVSRCSAWRRFWRRSAHTRNAALVEIRRSGRNGAAPSWTEYLVVAPEPDGTTRIDDVLFATRRSDTLRARLRAIAD